MYIVCMMVPSISYGVTLPFFVELSFELLSVLQALLASTVTLPNM